MIRATRSGDFPAILALNAESVHYLSPMDEARLMHLDAQAAYHRVVEENGRVLAFLLALCEGADYDSPNYRWFAAAFENFLYVDRVVVAKTHQGQRFGAALYDDLFKFARAEGIVRITCEFDLDPPNEASRKFHARYGFEEVGTQAAAGGSKRVSLQAASL